MARACSASRSLISSAISAMRVSSPRSSGVCQSHRFSTRGGGCGTRTGSASLTSPRKTRNHAASLTSFGSARTTAPDAADTPGWFSSMQRNATGSPDVVTTRTVTHFSRNPNGDRDGNGPARLPSCLVSSAASSLYRGGHVAGMLNSRSVLSLLANTPPALLIPSRSYACQLNVEAPIASTCPTNLPCEGSTRRTVRSVSVQLYLLR